MRNYEGHWAPRAPPRAAVMWQVRGCNAASRRRAELLGGLHTLHYLCAEVARPPRRGRVSSPPKPRLLPDSRGWGVILMFVILIHRKTATRVGWFVVCVCVVFFFSFFLFKCTFSLSSSAGDLRC